MSTPAHTSLSVQQFLAENGIDPHSHPPYSPDLTPRDFFVVVFSPVKKVLKGKHFADVGEVKQKAAEALKGIKIDKFKNRSEQWKNIAVVYSIKWTVLKVTEV